MIEYIIITITMLNCFLCYICKKNNTIPNEIVSNQINSNELYLENNINSNYDLEKIIDLSIKDYIDKNSNKISYTNLKDKDDECIICYENFDENNEILIFKCKHYFHRECIIKWLKKNNNCPICQDIIIPN